MAIIPLPFRLDWYDPSQPGGDITVLNNNSNTATSLSTQYTMEDIINTVSATGGSIDGSGAQHALPIFTDTNTITDLPLGSAGEILTSGGAGVDPSWASAAYLPLAGGTMTGVAGVIVPDDFKWNFGTGSDLAIYHDGSNSYVQETGTGGIIVEGSVVTLQSNEVEFSNQKYVEGSANSKTSLFYSGQEKFFTTSMGARIYFTAGGAGTLSFGDSENMTIEGNVTDQRIRISTSGSTRLVVMDTGTRLGNNSPAPMSTVAPTAPLVIDGLAVYADNAAAIAGGVEIGGVYRTGDSLKIVH